MSSEYLLAIDNGTQSVRAILFDLHGHIVAKSQVQLDAYFSQQPGWAEHGVEEYWQALCTACRRLWVQSKVPPSAVHGVAVTTQRGTVINLDRQGKPLRPAIVWLDQRRTSQVPRINPLWRAAFKLARVENTVDFFIGEAEAN